MRKTVGIMVLACLLLLVGCKSNESSTPAPKVAILRIEVSPNPIALVWLPALGIFAGNFRVTISEVNGQGGNISTIKAIFHHGGTDYESATNAGGSFVAFGSLESSFRVITAVMYNQIKIEVTGGDNGGTRIQKTELFDIAYLY